MKSWSVPRITSVGFGRKLGGRNPPYVRTHQAPSTSTGATRPKTNAVCFGNGARIEKSVLLCEAICGICGLRGRQNHLDIRPTILLSSGFAGVLGDRITGATPDGLEARRWNVRKILDDVVLHRQRTTLRQR